MGNEQAHDANNDRNNEAEAMNDLNINAEIGVENKYTQPDVKKND
jgi:hypothetical protein